MNKPELRTVTVERYLQPLREGGSLPALADADDGFKYVLKFKGAGHGPRMLISELLGGEIARVLGFKVPELVFALLDEYFGQSEADEEIQDLLKFSVGNNLGVHFLTSALTFDAVVNDIDSDLASKIVWLDAWIMNVDRTARNTNMLIWNKELWLIDHGAALYFHHNIESWQKAIDKPFVQISNHVLLPHAKNLDAIDTGFKKILTPEIILEIVQSVPDDWLIDEQFSVSEMKNIYFEFLTQRLSQSHHFIQAIYDAQK